jgi:hypothetical protein
MKSRSSVTSLSAVTAHMEGYYRSGLGPRAYCRQHGISEGTFYRWRRGYLSSKPASSGSLPVGKKFYPVDLSSAAPSGTLFSGLEIHYPHGVRVVIGGDHSMEIDKLRLLLQIML